jgi:CheY-like chemotaxis protein
MIELNTKDTEEINHGHTHVLIAEDDEIIYFYLNEVLKLHQIKTSYARDGEEAVEAIRTIPGINIILMDIRMPRMNGLEATRQIKLIRPEIPVIAQSAFDSEEDIRNALQAGCDDYISKPIDRRVLLKRLQKLSILNR